MFQKILVPIDLSEADIARPALDLAVEMAKSGGGQVRLIYILNAAVITAPMLYLPPVDLNELGQSEKDALTELAKKIDLPPERVTTIVRLGGVYPEVLAEAADWSADLIIISAHRPSMATYILGSSATAIVRHATCNVLVARSDVKAKLF